MRTRRKPVGVGNTHRSRLQPAVYTQVAPTDRPVRRDVATGIFDLPGPAARAAARVDRLAVANDAPDSLAVGERGLAARLAVADRRRLAARIEGDLRRDRLVKIGILFAALQQPPGIAAGEIARIT